MTDGDSEAGPLTSVLSFLSIKSAPRAFVAGATLFFMASAFGLFYFFFYIVKTGTEGLRLPTAQNSTVLAVTLLAQLAVPLLTIITSLISALLGYLLLRGA